MILPEDEGACWLELAWTAILSIGIQILVPESVLRQYLPFFVVLGMSLGSRMGWCLRKAYDMRNDRLVLNCLNASINQIKEDGQA